MWLRVPKFVVVGCAAALVHWVAVLAIVTQFGWNPLAANAAAWLVALQVSFAGHHLLTFRGHATPALKSAWRFALISLLGFAANETVFAVLMRWGHIPYPVALAIALAAVAGLTYLLSSRWAFDMKTRA